MLKDTINSLEAGSPVTLATILALKEGLEVLELNQKQLKEKQDNFDRDDWYLRAQEVVKQARGQRVLFADELERLVEEVLFSDQEMDRWMDRRMGEFVIKCEKGQIELSTYAKNISSVMAYAFWDLIKDTENYVDMAFTHPENNERIHVWVLKNGKLNPNQKKITILKERLSFINKWLKTHAWDFKALEEVLGCEIDDFKDIDCP